MKATLTSGHWEISEGNEGWGVFATETIDETNIPHLVAICGKGETGKADAHLIATAPDLYEALEHLDPAHPCLAKARGETQ